MNYLESVLCSYLKEKMNNDKCVQFYEAKSFWILMINALIRYLSVLLSEIGFTPFKCMELKLGKIGGTNNSLREKNNIFGYQRKGRQQ